MLIYVKEGLSFVFFFELSISQTFLFFSNAIKFVGTFSPILICETSKFIFSSTKCKHVCSTYLEETWLHYITLCILRMYSRYKKSLTRAGVKHRLRAPKESFISKISNLCPWADILGWNCLRHFWYFRPDDYQHLFWYREFLGHFFQYSTVISN